MHVYQVIVYKLVRHCAITYKLCTYVIIATQTSPALTGATRNTAMCVGQISAYFGVVFPDEDGGGHQRNISEDGLCENFRITESLVPAVGNL